MVAGDRVSDAAVFKLNLTTKIVLLVAVSVFATTGAMWFAASRQITAELEREQRDLAEIGLRALARAGQTIGLDCALPVYALARARKR